MKDGERKNLKMYFKCLGKHLGEDTSRLSRNWQSVLSNGRGCNEDLARGIESGEFKGHLNWGLKMAKERKCVCSILDGIRIGGMETTSCLTDIYQQREMEDEYEEESRDRIVGRS